MDAEYEFLPELFLRAPYYSFARYDLERLPAVLGDQVFRNALWLASPVFYKQLQAKNFDFNSLLEKEKNTLYKYYNRMCFRPTPFGSFASFTNLAWGNGGTVYLENDEQVRLHLLPDQGVISHLNVPANDLSNDTLLTKNPTLYRFGGEFRFVKSRPDNKGRYHFTIDAFKAEPFYKKIITLFKDGYFPAGQLKECILNYLECTHEEADGYLTFLLDEQILFGPSVGKVIYHENDSDFGSNVPGLAEMWQKARRNPITESGILANLSARMRELLPANKRGSDHLFYAAMERPLKSGGPGLDDWQELKLGIRALQLLSIPGASMALKQFTTEFSAKFDLEKVPLLKALDPDAGINYSNLTESIAENDVLKDIRFPVKANIQHSYEWTVIHRMLFKIWRDTTRDHFAPLELKESDLLELEKTNRMPSPPTLAVMYRKTESNLLIEHAGGATAASLIGRFSMFSEQTLNLARQIADSEQIAHPDIVFADISQLTDQHVDNINRRKMIYFYEIPLNVYTAGDDHTQIRPDDLYLSVFNGELILESKRLNKRVIPRLTTAYNYQHNELALFRLLCDLQYQGLNTSFTLDLEQFFPDMDFYPRICIGHVILACAQWRFTTVDLQFLQNENERDCFKQVREFRTRYHLPQRVSMGNGDQRLVFDLGNAQEAEFFIRCIGRLKKVMIQEYLLPDRSVKAGNRPMAGQYVSFMKHEKSIYAVPPKRSFNNRQKASRVFPLGSDWLYLKVYCTPESADLLLLHTLRPFLIKNRKYIKKWFFIRYFENGYHLRIRFNIEAQRIGNVLAAFKKQLNASGHKHLIKELQGDTYRRELERYGADLIHLVEGHFEASSDVVLKLLNEKSLVQPLMEYDTVFFIAYHLINCFLDDPIVIKLFANNMAEGFLSEFKADKELRMDIDAKYRNMKVNLTSLMEKPIADILSRKLLIVFKVLMDQTKVIAIAMSNKPIEQRSRFIADLVHMHFNRSFRINQRSLELLVYYCLYKYMNSKTARQKKAVHSD
jgi:thiopeptide-type bacteriocin biosynthesis protein